MSDNLNQIVYEAGTGEIVEKKSRFIAYISPAKSEEEALEFIQSIKKKHYDARHNCSAYIIGSDKSIERSSDDGEPSGTAGRPMLDVLNGEGLYNVVAVVTRYFGGTLLGTGGLIRAYQGAMKEGLKNTAIAKLEEGYIVKVETDYNGVGKLQYLARTMELNEYSSKYENNVEIEYLVPVQKIHAFEQDLTEQTSGQAKISKGDILCFGIVNGEPMIVE